MLNYVEFDSVVLKKKILKNEPLFLQFRGFLHFELKLAYHYYDFNLPFHRDALCKFG